MAKIDPTKIDEVKKLIEKGKEKGSLVYEEIMDALDKSIRF